MDASVREWWSVEDDPDDAMFLQMAARRAAVGPLRVFPTANEARDSLADPDAPRPAAILLDLNLPGMSGLQFLRWLRTEPAWRYLPVVVLSSSRNPRDMEAAYDDGANAYLVKP